MHVNCGKCKENYKENEKHLYFQYNGSHFEVFNLTFFQSLPEIYSKYLCIFMKLRSCCVLP